MNYKATLTFFFLVFLGFSITAQVLPIEASITEDGRLVYGKSATTGFYDIESVHKLEITLTEPNWFDILDGDGQGPNNNAGESLIGTVTLNDSLILDSVLVSIKGQTSDFRNNSEKKSFKLEIDEYLDQDLLGYDNLNLNCAFEDHSSMREVLYYDIAKPFATALKGSFIDLYINGQYWGPYNNIQQVEGRYIREWFSDNDGTRWRAVAPDDASNGSGGGRPGGGGSRFGTGVSSLNYNGPDSSDYNQNYTLKKTEKSDPWQDLIVVCDKLNNVPIEELYDSLLPVFDIDRALWFLIQENVFADDDSYINKGGMDYYVYWDITTERIMPLENDGNTVLDDRNSAWSPFYNEDDDRYPLLNRMLQNNEIRQRYLAHYRTVLDEYFIESQIHEQIDVFASILDQRVQDDPKKIYSHDQFLSGVVQLKENVANRIAFLSDHDEIDRFGLSISSLTALASDPPSANEEANITVEVAGSSARVLLYYSSGIEGIFERVEMQADEDTAGDVQVYTGTIPGFEANNYVRYYVEAISDDQYATATYFPAGAEHDVMIYQVKGAEVRTEDVVINEFMADNESTESDLAGEYDDWIELYNNGTDTIDLSGYYLSDDQSDLIQWAFPDGTAVLPNSYLIIWADDDGDQSSELELHANFKLSASGEEVVLVNASGSIVDLVEFGEQVEDSSYARSPNGTGEFGVRAATFDANNDDFATSTMALQDVGNVSIYPNPASELLNIDIDLASGHQVNLSIYNSAGQLVDNRTVHAGSSSVDTSSLSSGLYHLVVKDEGNNTNFTRTFIIAR